MMNQQSGTASEPVSREERLRQGLLALDVHLDDRQQQKLLAYQALLLKWNATYNLTAVRDPDSMLTHHLLDCISIVNPIKEALIRRPPMTDGDGGTEIPPRIIDVGSGAGLPGLIVAIACPEYDVIAIDPIRKKTAFMTQAIIELGINNSRVIQTKIEQFTSIEKVDVIISRAYAALKIFAQSISHLASPDTLVLAMKGKRPYDELAGLPDDWSTTEVRSVLIPGLNVERHLIFLRRS